MSQPVAEFDFEDRSTNPPTRGTLLLHNGQIIKIGRDERTNDRAFLNASVSRNHMEFYSILFEDGCDRLVYVRDRQSDNGTFVNGIRIGRPDKVEPGRLLEHGDTVTMKPYLSFKVKLPFQKRVEMTPIQKEEVKLFDGKYKVTDIILGQGASAEVRLAYDMKTGKQVACKIYDLQSDLGNGASSFVRKTMRSITMMSQIDHPNIASFKCAYKSVHTLYVFEELASGGDLFSLTSLYKRFMELEVRWMIRQVLEGLDYLHAKGVAHRDLKPENVLCMVSSKPAHRLALTDFGDAGSMKQGPLMDFVGTRGFQAPEMFQPTGAHDTAIDMWALGIMTAQLLAGSGRVSVLDDLEHLLPENPLIESLNFKAMFDEIKTMRGDAISACGQDFIRLCFETDPKERLTASDALKHPWINEPRNIRTLFESRAQQTRQGWNHRQCHVDLIRDLPNVLIPVTEHKEPKASTHGSNLGSCISDHFETANVQVKVPAEKSCPFGKVTKVGLQLSKDSDGVRTKLTCGDAGNKAQDNMGTKNTKKPGKRDNKGDLSSLEKLVFAKAPRAQRDNDDKKRMHLAELKERHVKIATPEMTWQLMAKKTNKRTKRTRPNKTDDIDRTAKRTKFA